MSSLSGKARAEILCCVWLVVTCKLCSQLRLSSSVQLPQAEEDAQWQDDCCMGQQGWAFKAEALAGNMAKR